MPWDPPEHQAKTKAILNLATSSFVGARSACLAEAVNQVELNYKTTQGDIDIDDLNIDQTASASIDCSSTQIIQQHHNDTAATFEDMMNATFPQHATTTNTITTALTSNDLQACYDQAVNTLNVNVQRSNAIQVTGSIRQRAEANVKRCVQAYTANVTDSAAEALTNVNGTTPAGATILCARRNGQLLFFLYASAAFFMLTLLMNFIN